MSVITPEVNIFNQAEFEAAVSELSTPAARADAIAYRLKKTATEEMEKDPAFYRKFSQMIEDTIEAYHQGRIDELDYREQMQSAVGTNWRLVRGVPLSVATCGLSGCQRLLWPAAGTLGVLCG